MSVFFAWAEPRQFAVVGCGGGYSASGMHSGQLLIGGDIPDLLALRMRYRGSICRERVGRGQVDCSSSGWSLNVGYGLIIGEMDWDQDGEIVAQVFWVSEPCVEQAKNLRSCRGLVGT